jgi:hypothetical protein
MNSYDQYYDDDDTISNVVKPWESPEESLLPKSLLNSTHVVSNTFRQYNGSSKSKNAFGGDSIFFLEIDDERSFNDNSTPPPSSSSSSFTSASYSSTSIDSSTDRDEVENFVCPDDTSKARMSTSRSITWGGPAKNISDYAIATSSIATEAANEALRRRAIRILNFDHHSHLHLDTTNPYTITSIGRGSSAADAIYERDRRPIWKQGYDHDYFNVESNEDMHKNDDRLDIIPDGNMTFHSPIISVFEQAAAMGRLKQQNRKKQDQQKEEQEQKKNTMLMSGNGPFNPKNKIKTARSNMDEDENIIESKGKEERILLLVNDADDNTSRNIIAESGKDPSFDNPLTLSLLSTTNEKIDDDYVDQNVTKDYTHGISGENQSKCSDSEGDTSTTASSILDTTATTAATSRMLIIFALAFGRFSSKLKKIRRNKRSEVEKE